VSITLFVLRGTLMLAGSGWLARPILRVAPHVVDTALLASALWLLQLTQQSPFHEAWIAAKIAGLLAYVVLGGIALRRGRSLARRGAAFAAAVAVAAWIVSVALSRDPAGFLNFLA
jgi:uncharacterized membrane protein SirB2